LALDFGVNEKLDNGLCDKKIVVVKNIHKNYKSKLKSEETKIHNISF
jgi:hypothetical protein